MLNSLSLKSKLVVMLLAVAIGCILVIGYQGLSNGERALKERVNAQLVSVRESKRFQVESWYQDLSSRIRQLSSNHTTIYAMREFKDAFSSLEKTKLSLRKEGRHWKNITRINFSPAWKQALMRSHC